MALGAPLSDLERIDAELAERHLEDFLEQAWPILEPSRPLIRSWHLGAICEHLEAVTRREIRALLINIPPGTMKSLTTAVVWPAWVWLRDPAHRWLFSSYADKLSKRDSRRCRNVIRSPWYRARWGDRFALLADQDQVVKFENDRTGFRLATSVDGANTGERGDTIVVDDPHNVREAESEKVREGVVEWWREVMSSRLNDQTQGAKVVIMQRVHGADLAGWILDHGGYEHLNIPLEREPKCIVEKPHPCSATGETSIGFSDPRPVGEVLLPSMFPPAERARLEGELGAYAYAGQYQQRPAPRESALFRVGKLRLVDAIPQPEPGPHGEKRRAIVRSARGWDKAGTEGAGDYTAGVKIARLWDGRFIIVHAVRDRLDALEREELIRATARLDGVATRIRLEQEPGSGGKESAQASVRGLAGYVVTAAPTTGDKVHNAEPFAIQVNAGNVLILRGDWNEAFIEELRGFPAGKNDDFVDAASRAFNELQRPGTGAGSREVLL